MVLANYPRGQWKNVHWRKSATAAVAEARRTGKPLLVVFHTSAIYPNQPDPTKPQV